MGVWLTNMSAVSDVLPQPRQEADLCPSTADSTYSYPAYDLFSLPMSSATSARTSGLAYSALNSDPQLGVIDFSLTRLANDSFVLAGGADSSGSLVSFDNVGVWDSAAGWRVVQTKGDTPAPRAGHNMLAHPALDMLVLHGGATNTANLSATASTTLAFLNTTTMTWSQPSNLQPPTSFARAWHSSIMVSSGVLVTAFGLSAEGTPRSDIVYLDMRSNDPSKWTWKAVWSAAMLDATLAYSPIKASTDSANGLTTDSRTLRSVLIPVLIFLVLGVPLAIWLLRRHVRNVRHRRMAQHFEMDPEEDHRRGSFMPVSALGQFISSKFGKSSGGSPRLPKPFGGVRINDKGEVNNNNEHVVVSQIKGIFKRFSQSSFASFGSVESTAQDKEMAEIRAGVAGIITNGMSEDARKPHQWEEIDFGLGKIDESRRHSAVPRASASFEGLRESEIEKSELVNIPEIALEGPFGDEFQIKEQQIANSSQLSPPALVILPPSQPSTPNIDSNGNQAGFVFDGMTTFADSPVDTLDGPVTLQRETATTSMKDEWKSLADSLVAHPIFGASTSSIAPVRTAHDDSHSTVANPMTVLPPLAFQQRRTSGSGLPDLTSYPGLRISPETRPLGHKRDSATSIASTSISNRSVSQPMSSPIRDLTSMTSARKSGEYADIRAEAKVKAANRVSASGIYDKFRSPYVGSPTTRPVSSYSSGDVPVLASPISSSKRYSAAPLSPPPVLPLPVLPSSNDNVHYSPSRIERYPSKRESIESKLRVVNMSSDVMEA